MKSKESGLEKNWMGLVGASLILIGVQLLAEKQFLAATAFFILPGCFVLRVWWLLRQRQQEQIYG